MKVPPTALDQFWGHPRRPVFAPVAPRRGGIPHLTTRGELGLLLTPMYAAMAKANLQEAGKKHGKGHPKGSQNSVDPIQPIDTQKEVAKIAGVSENLSPIGDKNSGESAVFPLKTSTPHHKPKFAF